MMTGSGPVPVVTIDGPSGSGKGTIGRLLAQALGWHFLDSGALYRILALAAGRQGIALEEEAGLKRLARRLDVEFRPAGKGGEDDRILLDGKPVGTALRTEACGNAASRVAALPGVREALLERQRGFRRPPGLVADGRDMGTVVFPDATTKIFLTASAAERARRRYNQLKEKGLSANLSDLVLEIEERDRRDAARATAPLKPAVDAHQVDTTGMAVQDTLEVVLGLVREGVRP